MNVLVKLMPTKINITDLHWNRIRGLRYATATTFFFWPLIVGHEYISGDLKFPRRVRRTLARDYLSLNLLFTKPQGAKTIAHKISWYLFYQINHFMWERSIKPHGKSVPLLSLIATCFEWSFLKDNKASKQRSN